ncbi:MAG: ribonuclease HII [Limisphaerales bacterium]|nr:MAG: ribonuclease HII [Limisphaerales bacterium]KAG0508475.1 MAG: ribonuclease HII [Limisphaerales bacterium]TXT47877.1 MAG: ribonuclease HII [Limisphaerales bacterium]
MAKAASLNGRRTRGSADAHVRAKRAQAAADVAVRAPAMDRLAHERELLATGVTLLAGLDEAGRGPLAGPVVAAAVMFPADWLGENFPAELEKLNDSKQLTEAQREHYFTWLTSRLEVRFAIAAADAAVIDRINILQATHRAMNDALAQLTPTPAHVLVDGLRVKSLRLPQTPLVKGDARSYSIAAASVLAKVTRDRLMREFDRRFPGYGFAEHKGYGTPAHLAAIAKLGPCPIHRRSFAPLKAEQEEFVLR